MMNFRLKMRSSALKMMNFGLKMMICHMHTVHLGEDLGFHTPRRLQYKWCLISIEKQWDFGVCRQNVGPPLVIMMISRLKKRLFLQVNLVLIRAGAWRHLEKSSFFNRKRRFSTENEDSSIEKWWSLQVPVRQFHRWKQSRASRSVPYWRAPARASLFSSCLMQNSSF